MKSLTLAVPSSKLQPPPKKSEVIDAMTRLEVEKRNKASRERYDLRQKLTKEAELDLILLAQKDPAVFAMDARIGDVYSNSNEVTGIKVYVNIQERQLPSELKAKLRQIHSLPEYQRDVSFADVRKQVSASVNGMLPHDERVSAMLKDDTTRASLEKMLEAIS